MLAIIKLVNGVKKIIPLTADIGAGAPVGSLTAMYKKSAPSGYLYCDGSTFDETVYPVLYQYLGTNVLPDYREFALVGAEENTTSSNIATHDIYTQGEEKDDQFQYHRHEIPVNTGTSGQYRNITGAPNKAVDYAESTLGIVSGYGRHGTVTRGKRKAVYFYIKATSGLPENQQDNVLATINANNSYSTTEHATGKKWIDGKSIYKKTVNIGTLPNNTTKSVSLGIVMASLVSVQGYAHRTLDGLVIPIPFVNPSLLNQNVAVTFPLVNNVTNIRVLTASDLTVYETCYITIEYTKN